MITFEAPAIRAEFRTGQYTKAELARKYNCHPETITNILNRTEDQDVYVRTKHLDNLLIIPYLDYIRGLLKKGNVQATVIYQKLIEMGACISLSTVSRAVKRVKHELDLSAIRYETAPGQQAQADWADFRGYTATVDGYERPLHAFFLILGHSRMRYVEFVTEMTRDFVLYPSFLPLYYTPFHLFLSQPPVWSGFLRLGGCGVVKSDEYGCIMEGLVCCFYRFDR